MKTQRIKTLLLFLSMIPFIGIYANQYTTFPLTHHRVEMVVSRLLFIQFTKLSKKPERIKIALQFTCGRGNMF